MMSANTSARRERSQPTRARRARLLIEALETRSMLATLVSLPASDVQPDDLSTDYQLGHSELGYSDSGAMDTHSDSGRYGWGVTGSHHHGEHGHGSSPDRGSAAQTDTRIDPAPRPSRPAPISAGTVAERFPGFLALLRAPIIRIVLPIGGGNGPSTEPLPEPLPPTSPPISGPLPTTPPPALPAPLEPIAPSEPAVEVGVSSTTQLAPPLAPTPASFSPSSPAAVPPASPLPGGDDQGALAPALPAETAPTATDVLPSLGWVGEAADSAYQSLSASLTALQWSSLWQDELAWALPWTGSAESVAESEASNSESDQGATDEALVDIAELLHGELVSFRSVLLQTIAEDKEDDEEHDAHHEDARLVAQDGGPEAIGVAEPLVLPTDTDHRTEETESQPSAAVEQVADQQQQSGEGGMIALAHEASHQLMELVREDTGANESDLVNTDGEMARFQAFDVAAPSVEVASPVSQKVATND